MSTNFKGKVRSFIKEVKLRTKAFSLSSIAVVFCGMTLVSAYAGNGIKADDNLQIDFSTVSEIATDTTAEKERDSATTYVTTTCVMTTTTTTTETTAVETTATETTTTTTETTTYSSTEAVNTEMKTLNEIVEEAVYEIESSNVEEDVSYTAEEDFCYYSDERTRPYISTGAERLASMMANEGGSSDITCLRTAIGFMNRIHNSQFLCGSIEQVYGYCFSTPNQHHKELAEEVITAYNESDASWYQYCVDHSLTDKTVFHHNGTTPQSFEQPGGFVEYGDTGWYQWTLLYSESIYDHY